MWIASADTRLPNSFYGWYMVLIVNGYCDYSLGDRAVTQTPLSPTNASFVELRLPENISKTRAQEILLVSILTCRPTPAGNAQERNAQNLAFLKSAHRHGDSPAQKKKLLGFTFSRQSAAECFH
jgi:hypothetical protein